MYTPRTIANSQTERAPIKTKMVLLPKYIRILVEPRDTIRHLKTSRVISNEMPVFLKLIVL